MAKCHQNRSRRKQRVRRERNRKARHLFRCQILGQFMVTSSSPSESLFTLRSIYG